MIDTLKKGDNLQNFYIFGGSFVGFIIICMTSLCCISKSVPAPRQYSFKPAVYEDLGEKATIRLQVMDTMIKEMRPGRDKSAAGRTLNGSRLAGS